jgi:Kef-type K+ transport system membrane component KefB
MSRLLEIAVILAAAHLLGLVFRWFGQPRVVGEMTAGILLGPSLLGWVAPGLFTHLFPSDGFATLNALSQIGLILFLFVVGMEARLPDKAGLGALTGAASVASLLTPLFFGGLLAIPLHRELASDVPGPTFVLFMAVAMSITAFPVLARILMERGMLQTRAGTIAISCAAIDDVLAWCLVALLMAASAVSWIFSVAGLLAYAAAMWFGVRSWLTRHKLNLPAALLLLLASSWVTEALSVHALFGAFMAGLVMPRGAELAKLIEPLTSALLLPLFFALTGLRTSIALVSSGRLWFICAAIIIVAISAKLFGCACTLRARGLPWRESLTVGTLVNTRGLIELVVLNIGLDRRIISPTLFSMMVLMALVTTFMTTPLMAFINRK